MNELKERLQLCSHCGQPMPPIRLGVKLTPLKSRILDAVILKGGDGIVAIDLAEKMGMTPETLKVHVAQINEKLFDAGHRIYGRGGRYRLIRTKMQLPTAGES